MSAHSAVATETLLREPADAPALPRRDIILLVEDDQAVATLLVRLIERLNWRVAVARDGADCLNLLETHCERIAAALVDCTLPDAHGGSLCQKLREVSPGLPILLTSGRSQPGLLELIAADGPAGFLPKPFLPADVNRHLLALLPVSA